MFFLKLEEEDEEEDKEEVGQTPTYNSMILAQDTNVRYFNPAD